MTTTTKTRLGDVGTAHVWFTSVGSPAGCDLFADEGEPVELPSESWWDLEGTVAGNKWEWDGQGRPADFRGNTVQRIVAFKSAEEPAADREKGRETPTGAPPWAHPRGGE